MTSVKALLRESVQKLSESDSPLIDAQLLLAEAMGVDRAWLMTWDDVDVDESSQASFQTSLERRIRGEPMAYILGRREFWGLEFICNAHTLIPRPETEHLVEWSLALDLPENANVLEMGTGTGCIAIASATEQPDWQLTATDLSEKCISLANENAQRLGAKKIEFLVSDWYQAIELSKTFDLIVSNPPYIDPASPYLQVGDVRYEPDSALTATDAGYDALRHIIERSADYLKQGGWLLLEHGCDQGESVRAILVDNGFSDVETIRDLAQLDRCSGGRLFS